jgi:peptide/nickel transport system permease protein
VISSTAGSGQVALPEDATSAPAWLYYTRQLLHTRSGAAGAAIVGFLVLMAVLAPLIAPADPMAVAPAARLEGPSLHHLFGTDDLGRDLLSRVIYGARYSLGGGVSIVLIGAIVGLVVGLIAGYFGGWLDEVLMRVTDVFLAFPSLILALAVAAALGPSLVNAVIAIGAVWWPWYARLARSQTLRIRSQPFIAAAVVSGARSRHILPNHILRNTMSPVIVQMSLDVGYAILTLAGLSFIGLGAQPPTPEWGSMISVGRDYYLTQWWFVTFPGLALLLTVAGFILLSDGLLAVLPSSKGTA